MSGQEPKELAPELKQLLRSASAPLPPPGFDAAVLARVKSTLLLPPAPPAPPAAGAAAGMATKMGAWGMKVSLAMLAIGLAAGGLIGSRLGGEPTPVADALPSSEAAPAPVPARIAQPAPAPVPATPAPTPALVAAAAKKPAAQPVKSVPPLAPGSRDVNLADERGLIEVARTSLGRREAARTLELLAEHGRRFPSGQLSEERDSLWVQALVNVGRYPDARLKAQEFHLKYPESMMRASVVDAAVEAIAK